MGDTTEIIQKRIRHWKTTLVGVASLVAPIALSIWPQHSQQIIAAMMAINGVGFMAAADAKPKTSVEPTTPTK
jgi:hypothetical protein